MLSGIAPSAFRVEGAISMVVGAYSGGHGSGLPRTGGQQMTLVVTAFAHRSVIHVSDRLISTKVGADRYRQHDAFSNKTIVVIAENCWLVLGYTGQAYFGESTTDQHLASAVSSIDLRGEMVFGSYFSAKGVDYREVIRRVADAVRLATIPTTVSIAGFCQPKGKASARRLFVDVVATADGRVQVLPLVGKRKRKQSPQCVLLHPIGWIDQPVRQELSGLCQPEEITDPEIVRTQLVALLQSAGSRDIPVGRDTMSVVLYPFESRGKINFHSAEPVRQAEVIRRRGTGKYADIAGFCTPYILMGGGGISEPSIATGKFAFGRRGGPEFEISGFNTDEPDHYFEARPQTRTPPPKR